MALLEVKDLTKKFGNTEVLRGISFDVEQGEVLSMIGSSGGGKTTLLRCLNLLEIPNGGTIKVGDEYVFDVSASDAGNIKSADLRRRRLKFGLVFQQFNLFPQYTAFENICLAPKLLAKESEDYKNNKAQKIAEIEENARALLSRVGLSDKEKSYPCQLSGGQQQRVAIARALALKPEILCFDEPTSALDPELTKEVLNVIRDLKTSGMTMIVVTHEMEFAKSVSDKVIFISKGIIEEAGTAEQVFSNPKSIKTKNFLNG